MEKNSVLYKSSINQITSIWEECKNIPDVDLKHELWQKNVTIVYGKKSNTALFLEHTYLTIISKCIANASFGEDVKPNHILNGKNFKDINIFGVVEDDFFSWIAHKPEGLEVVKKIHSHIKRFDFSKIKSDLLKDLYEELIDVEQRHAIGEYYTPDWLAEKVCKEIIKDPLKQKIIDPSCGSGTFLFHAITLLIKKANKEKMNSIDIIKLVCNKIVGIDIHPVANIFSRVTFLLAILSEIKKQRPNKIIIPVYLGDSLQWSVKDMIGGKNLEIYVPKDENIKSKKRILIFPNNICSDIKKFNEVLNIMLNLIKDNKTKTYFKNWAKNEIQDNCTIDTLINTYQNLLELTQEGRNHIWGYIARNLTKPIWLSNEDQKADVVIGNPPWLKYNSMTEEMKNEFKTSCDYYGLWAEKTNLVTSQDLSKLFFAKSMDLYMKETGKIAFIMPLGSIIGDHYINFKKGNLSKFKIKFKNIWKLGYELKNLFKVPCCVLFAELREKQNELAFPKKIIKFSGKLTSKNTTLEKATQIIREEKEEWNNVIFDKFSYYYNTFLNGAALYPRRLVIVEKQESSSLGGGYNTIFVKGVTSKNDKEPWKQVDPITGTVEKQFIRKAYFGASIAPFRIIDESSQAIIPFDTKEKKMLNSEEALKLGHMNLGNLLNECEKKWDKYRKKSRLTFKKRINYQNTLSNQFPIKKIRVAYTSSGSRVSCTTITDLSSVIDTSLYWTFVNSKNESLYLEGILNSESLRLMFENLQSEGSFGKRHISRNLLKPNIPKYDKNDLLHQDIIKNTANLKKEVSQIDISGMSESKARSEIRKSIDKNKINQKLNNLIDDLFKESQKKAA